MAAPQERPSPYRWAIEVLLLLTLLIQSITWLAPAPILTPIIKGLHISLGQAGLIISIIALCIAIFSFCGALVSERIGALRAMILGVWLMGIAEVASGYTAGFGALLICRVVEGIGYGLMIAPPATLLMEWFPMAEWPYINMVNFLCGYVGLTLVFRMTVPIYHAVGSSWETVLRNYGLAAIGLAVLWTIFGRERNVAAASAEAESVEPRASTLGEVFKMRDVVLLAIGLFGGMWVFQLYTAFLPQYFHAVRGFPLAAAAALTAVLPLTGIFAAGVGGIGTALSGLRRPFMWPVAIATLVGCVGAIELGSTTGIEISLVLVGIGAAGSLAAFSTLLLELPGMTPAKVGTANALIWSAGYAGAFISPFLGGAIASAVGLRAVMLGFLVFQLLPIICMYLIPETGRGARLKEHAPAPAAATGTR